MNKQELIKSYEDDHFGIVSVDRVLKDLRQLDESQKVTIPQFVADYIKYAIENDWDFQDLFKCIEDEEDEELLRWVYHERNQETLAAAWLDGYTVEKEPKYTVKIKSVNQYLVRNTDEDFLGFLQSRLKSKFTRKELEEADLSDVFNSPLFEVEEVEE